MSRLSFFSRFAVVASVVMIAACGGPSGSDGSDDPSGPSGPDGARQPSGTSNACTGTMTRSGVVAGASVDFAAEPYDTTWYNTSLEEIALSPVDEETMKSAGLSPSDKEDVRRFKYFTRGFDFRWLAREPVQGDLLRAKRDLSVYLFDVAETGAAPDAVVSVYDVSAVREARRSGDTKRLGATLRQTVDAMRADARPKAVVAFAPDRSHENAGLSLLINMFAEDVYFATSGTVKLSNLRDGGGAAIGSATYPLRTVATLDLTVHADVAGSAITVDASCLPVRISGP